MRTRKNDVQEEKEEKGVELRDEEKVVENKTGRRMNKI